MKKTKTTTKVVWLLLFALFLTLLVPAGRVRAEGTLQLNETKLTLYQGNCFQLEYSGVEETTKDGWMGGWYVPSFSTKDPSVAVVDSGGLVRAVGVGTTEITVWFHQQKATCTVKVRKNSCKLDCGDLVLYRGQEMAVKLTGKKKAKSYTYYVDDIPEGDYDWNQPLKVKSLGKGGFSLSAEQAGEYTVDFVMRAANGEDYSARCFVTVLPCGLDSPYLAVAEGCKAKITLQNAEFVSCVAVQAQGTVEPDGMEVGDGNADLSGGMEAGDWGAGSSDGTEAGNGSASLSGGMEAGNGSADSSGGEVSVSKKGVITAKKAGHTELAVTYKTAFGETKSEPLFVDVTEPKYIPFTSYLWGGDNYTPEFEGISPYSRITVTSDNEAVVAVRKMDWSNTDDILPQEAGTANLLILADGVSFMQEVTVVNPQLSAYYMAIEKGKAKKLKVAGTQEGNKIKFSSSDKTVASVTKAGKITAKKNGAARITVTVDGREFYCTVTVGTGKGVKAVQKAESVLGAAYSQEKRMQEGYYDCSSLVWRSYNAAGEKLAGAKSAPTAAELARKLEAEGKAIAYQYVPADELMPGDIIFYQGYNNNSRYKIIDHVALYYGADCWTNWWFGDEMQNSGIIIHASGCVSMSSYDWYRTESIVMIARPVQ